ncbi:hypothetical protein [Nonomuraea sp. NPDC049141]
MPQTPSTTFGSVVVAMAAALSMTSRQAGSTSAGSPGSARAA